MRIRPSKLSLFQFSASSFFKQTLTRAEEVKNPKVTSFKGEDS